MNDHLLQISSLQNPKIKQVQKLFDRRERDETHRFVIEGYRELKRALDAAVEVEGLFICPSLFLGGNEQVLINQAKNLGASVYRCEENVFHKISYRDRPDGLIAIAKQARKKLTDLDDIIKNKKNPFFLVAEAIEKPGNLGTILRSCDAAGVDAVIVCDRCTDIYNPNVVRASVGTLFTVPVIEAGSIETIEWFFNKGVQMLAATPHAKMDYTEADLKGPVAIVVGTEQLGLSDLWMKKANIQVSIPMRGVADSLNVATATTLLLYEVLRQRKGPVA